MTPAVLIAITSRDGRLRGEVRGAVQAAMVAGGTDVDLRVGVNPYSVAANRNEAVGDFLGRKQFSHLLFVDDDVIVPPRVIPDLLAVNAHVAGGCVPSVRAGNPYVQVQPRGVPMWLRSWPAKHETIAAGAVGGGCMMIRRDVFEVLGFPWFVWQETYSEAGGYGNASEDSAFCYRATEAGLLILAAGSVRCGHLKTVDVGVCVPEG